MAFVVKDRVRVSTATTGTGTVTLGAAVQNAAKGYYRTFAAAGVANGDTVPYLIEDAANWEIGIGTYVSTGTQLQRTTVLSNSAGTTSAISLSGAAEVALVMTEAAWARKAEAGEVREKLTSDRTYYVRTDGSDSNTGLANTVGGAFLTLTRAAAIVQTLDFAGFSVTIQVADGTYTAGFALLAPTLGGLVTLLGNVSTPGNCVISTTGGPAVLASGGAAFFVGGFRLQTSGSGDCLRAEPFSLITQAGPLAFGACAGNSHVSAAGGTIVNSAYSNAIVGACARHQLAADTGSILTNNGGTITHTLSGTPAFSVAFAQATRRGGISGNAGWSGSATGPRYSADSLGLIQTYGSGASYFPGNAVGTTAT